LASFLSRHLGQVLKRHPKAAGFRQPVQSLPTAQAATGIFCRVAKRQPEAWICFSSMSFQLFCTWKSVSQSKVAWAFIPEGSILLEDQGLSRH
jgi:hypothetical protein